jgi:hypothetical protein
MKEILDYLLGRFSGMKSNRVHSKEDHINQCFLIHKKIKYIIVQKVQWNIGSRT